MANVLTARIAQLLAGAGAPQDQPVIPPVVPAPAGQVDPAMLYGTQPAPAGDAPMHPALQALQQHFALLNLLRNQRNQGMNDVQGIDADQVGG
jgi:hypothetical protein